jgi:hypothetical protein
MRDGEIIESSAGIPAHIASLYNAARGVYGRTGRPLTDDTTATEWRALHDEGLSTLAASFIADFDLAADDPAAVLSRSSRPLGSAHVLVSVQPKVKPGRLGPLKIRLDVLGRFRPALLRDAGIKTFLDRSSATSPDQTAAEAAQSASQAEQLGRDTAKAGKQADRVSSFQAGDLAASAELVGDVIGRVAGGVVSVAARVLGSGVGAFVGALPPAVIVAVGVAAVAGGVYAVRRLTA